MSPRNSAAGAVRTRERIVRHATDIASIEGLEGLTIGRLASDLAMSKAGVLGHFGSKQRLQLAAVEHAMTTFRRTVWDPAEPADAGTQRLHRVCESWIGYLQAGVFPGGCFLTAAACEFDGRAGPVREAVAAGLRLWRETLIDEVTQAVSDGDLPADTDPAQVAFELNAVAQATNQGIQLHNDAQAAARGLRAMRRILDA